MFWASAISEIMIQIKTDTNSSAVGNQWTCLW
jgi:hypothetical protein